MTALEPAVGSLLQVDGDVEARLGEQLDQPRSATGPDPSARTSSAKTPGMPRFSGSIPDTGGTWAK
ncbi:hypothetical protein [Streptomyces sp. NTK 937]|uniref:hypothetical protein n=1 Tax=Streptomyces sp. NTK 937 TaxID=1487711 RepID=UPI0004A93DCE|nr:hypothetical protein [Streptomyces sp. NTK 937]KDQ67514.1 hypothetical protein DT87_09880 [Streptomyces sp. NTK 937]